MHVLLPLPINSQFLGIHETRRGRNRHHSGANASMHVRTHAPTSVATSPYCIALHWLNERMPEREREREREREIHGGCQSGRHAVQRATNDFSLRSRAARNVLFICSLSTILASVSLDGFARETSLVCYKGREVEPCLQAPRMYWWCTLQRESWTVLQSRLSCR